jgi:hypothetical protein
LHAGHWLISVPAYLRDEADSRLMAAKKQWAARRARELATEAWEAYGAFDYDRAGEALREWDRLAQKDYFQPPADLENNVAEVREWHQKQQEERRREREFQEILHALREAVKNGADGQRLEQLMFEAREYEMEMPENLRKRAQKAINDARLRRRRRRRVIVAVAAVLVVLAGLGVYRAVRRSIFNRERERYLSAVRSEYERGNYEGGERIIANMEEKYPAMADGPLVQEWAHRLREARAKVAADKREFNGFMTRLEEARDEGFPDDVPYAQLERRARRLVHDETQQRRLSAWQAARQAHERRVSEERSRRFKERLEEAANALDRIKELDPTTHQDAYQELIDQADEQLARAREIPGDSEWRQQQLVAFRQKLRDAVARLNSARKTLQKRRDLMRRITANHPNIEEYAESLRRFVDEFPGHPQTETYRRVLEDIELGRDLLKVGAWEFDDPEVGLKEVRAFLDSPAGKQSLWRDSLAWQSHVWETRPAREALADKIDKFHASALFTRLRALNSDGRGLADYYYLDEPKETGLSGQNVIEYEIDALKTPDDSQKVKVRLEGGIAADPAEVLAPHCRWFREFYRRFSAARSEFYAPVSLRGLDELQQVDQVDPVVVGLFFQSLLPAVEEMCYRERARIQRLRKQFDGINTNVPWMDYDPAHAVRDARKQVKDLLQATGSLQPIYVRLAAIGRLHGKALERGVDFVGRVAQKEEGLMLQVGGYDGEEVWMVREKQGMREVWIAGRKTEDGSYEPVPEVEDELYPGRPLFAPADGRSSTELAGKVLPEAYGGPRNLPDPDWPRSWPVNARQSGSR